MPFDLIPAIDLAGGRLAAYTPGGPRAVEAFGGDPTSAAEAFVAAGARWLHVVDMDQAFSGDPLNIGSMMAIRRAALFAGAKIQASGGLVRDDDLSYVLDVGVDRVVIGSGALVDPKRVSRLASQLGGRLAVGLEIADGRIKPRGASTVDLSLLDTLAWLEDSPVARFVVTAVGRVSSLSGPDLEVLRSVRRLGRPIVAAGGIASLDDLRAVRDEGAEAAVVGRAALEGGLDLEAGFALREA